MANPSAVEELLVALPDSLADLHFIEDRRQAIEKAADGNLRLLVRATPYDGSNALELPIRDIDLAPYLQSSLYIQVEDLRIQELARALRGDERDAWKVALRLRQWVYDHMVPRDTNVRFKSTLEVLEDMEGTCSEYAALYLALCRAVGLPARAAVGFIASHTGELVLHIWTQVYVGEWIDLDPSWAAETVAAAHIKTGQGLLTASGQRRLNGALAQWFAHVNTLELVEYTADDQRFSSAAERLFAEGSQAEKRFVDVRAQELYHQSFFCPGTIVARRPWSISLAIVYSTVISTMPNGRSGACCGNKGMIAWRMVCFTGPGWPLRATNQTSRELISNGWYAISPTATWPTMPLANWPKGHRKKGGVRRHCPFTNVCAKSVVARGGLRSPNRL